MQDEAVTICMEVYQALHYEAPPNWVMDYVEYVSEALDHKEEVPSFHDYLRFQIQVCDEDLELQPGYKEDLTKYITTTGGHL